MTKETIASEMQLLQDRICNRLEKLDAKGTFYQDIWKREEGGGGRTRVIKDGNVIEKGGVNFSEVHGKITPTMKHNTEVTGDSFFATGVSIVLHPNNPHVPIIHMNVRYFETDDGTYWFGGGIDLTPHYVIPSQARQFHEGLKQVCDKYKNSFYPDFKKWADDYFFIPHREETRGVGGIFFDHLSEKNALSKEQLFQFCIELGDTFCDLYENQVQLGVNKTFSEDEIKWMHLRRGRYVEFNLVNDRGTKFGLYSGGRTESILMSLPSNASWEYCFEPKEDSPELETLNSLKKDISWVKG